VSRTPTERRSARPTERFPDQTRPDQSLFESGPWWRAAGTDGEVRHDREDPTAVRCTVCGRTAARHGEDHDFSQPRPKLDPETVAAHVAALKAELAPTSGPTDRRTLADMAEANPVLHAKVEALRAANPGLESPPMHEPEPDPQPEEAAMPDPSPTPSDVQEVAR
jgi:hypothetical protein